MKKILIPILSAIPLLSGCASLNSLVFADRTTFGATVKIDPKTSDYLVNVGSDMNSFALVPVFDKDGKVILIDSTDAAGKNMREAASVFASFKADTGTANKSGADTGINISFGRIFATGQAAVISANRFAIAAEKVAEAEKINKLSKLNDAQVEQLDKMQSNAASKEDGT